MFNIKYPMTKAKEKFRFYRDRSGMHLQGLTHTHAGALHVARRHTGHAHTSARGGFIHNLNRSLSVRPRRSPGASGNLIKKTKDMQPLILRPLYLMYNLTVLCATGNCYCKPVIIGNSIWLVSGWGLVIANTFQLDTFKEFIKKTRILRNGIASCLLY